MRESGDFLCAPFTFGIRKRLSAASKTLQKVHKEWGKNAWISAGNYVLPSDYNSTHNFDSVITVSKKY
ncbi:hypothetical protein RR48_14213 [Papilio machaon]|uniref:Uncharacterized protein n=1 Tax=Papilio machaon TaxID=76193 RepID=A0A194QM86_PAPMA|nr:hypothetical protein RR48_14213 [Papilio machaon]